MQIKVLKSISKEQIIEINKMCIECFDEFVGVDYSRKGKETFYNFSSTENLEKLFNSGELMIVAKHDEKVVGFLSSAKDQKHLALLFVNKSYHKRGIARSIFASFIDQVKGLGHKEISVNSSPYAIQVYEKLGFVTVGELEEREGSGIVAQAMKYVMNNT